MKKPVAAPDNPLIDASRGLAAILLGGLFGWGLWALSPLLLKHDEPWDWSAPGYMITMFVVGAVLALLAGRFFWTPALGLFLGQLTFGALEADSFFTTGRPPGWLSLMTFALVIFSCPPAIMGGFTAWLTMKLGQAWIRMGATE